MDFWRKTFGVADSLNDKKLVSKVNKFILIFIGVMFISLPSWAQRLDPKYETIFMYQISKYIEWPADMQTFVIGIVGAENAPIVEEIKKMAQLKKVNGKPIEVKVFSDAAAVTDCRMLFVTFQQSAGIPTLSEKCSGKKTLLISEKSGMAKQGAAINFINKGGKMKFELNKSNLSKAGLKVSSSLERLAIII